VNKSYSWFDETGLMVLPYHPYITNKYAAAGSLQRYDIEMTPTLFTVATGHHLRLVVSTQPATNDCASLLSALKTPLPCLPTKSQLATLKGGRFQLLWGPSTPSSVNVPVLAQDALPVTTSGTTPTSNGLIEPLMWSSSRPTQ
jgi:hypothetical protein